MIDIVQAIQDENLFRPLFKNLKSWGPWMTFLRALFNLPMAKSDVTLIRQCTGRQKLFKKPVREAWVPTGRRSGKSFIAALVAVYLACFRDYRPHLAPGERAVVAVIAADRRQAQIILRYIKGFLNSNHMLAKLVEAERVESIELINLVTIEVKTCSFRSIRGPSYAAVICDEIAFWADDSMVNPAHEVLRAIRPGLATIPDSLLLCISSPYARSGPLWQACRDHHGRDDSDVLVWQAPTTVMNETIARSIIARDMESDPEMAKSEWLAHFRIDIESFLTLEAIEGCIVPGRYELAAMPRTRYFGFCDVSGGRRDAATLAIAHQDQDQVVVDLARRWPSPHKPGTVVREMVTILQKYGLSRVVGDKYSAGWVEGEFRRHTIQYLPSSRNKSELYLSFQPMINSGRIELLDLKHLKNELVALERRTRGGGRDLVDHPPKSHDDLANSVAGAAFLVGAGLGRAQARVRWI